MESCSGILPLMRNAVKLKNYLAVLLVVKERLFSLQTTQGLLLLLQRGVGGKEFIAVMVLLRRKMFVVFLKLAFLESPFPP